MDSAPRPSVLVITPRFPYPPIGGDLLRIYTIIEHLAADFDVDVFSFYGNDDELAGLAGLQRVCREVRVFRHGRAARLRSTAAGWLRGLPLQVAHYYTRAARRDLDDWLAQRDHDAVLAHLVRSAEYTRGLVRERVVLEMTDAIAMNYYRITRPASLLELVYLAERRRLAAYEAAAVGRVGRAVVVSQADRRFLAELGASGPIDVITNGTDVHPVPGVSPDRRTVAFLGNLRTAPNQDMVVRFARRILPLVRAQVPDARFEIIGANAPDAVRRLHDGNSIVFTGRVPDPARALAGAWLSVCPMAFGAGVQNKVLESLAVGVPVVTTAAGLEGIDASPGEEILVGEDDRSFAAQVVALLADEGLRDRLSRAGLRFVDREFRWERPMARYARVVREAGDAAVGRR